MRICQFECKVRGFSCLQRSWKLEQQVTELNPELKGNEQKVLRKQPNPKSYNDSNVHIPVYF